MSDRSCTDCKYKVEGRDNDWCGAPKPKAYTVTRNEISKSAPFTGCTSWERRELTREQRIEKAALGLLARWDASDSGVIQVHIIEALREALATPAPAAPAAPSESTEADMRRVVQEAGWTLDGNRWSIDYSYASAWGWPLHAAYERVMRERGGK